jgi:hypothetical protein
VATCHDCGLVSLTPSWSHAGAKVFYRDYYRPLVNAWHDKPAGYDWAAETRAYRDLVRPYWLGIEADEWLDLGGDAVNPEHGTGLIEEYVPTRQYQLVTCCQTLDHLCSPRQAFHVFAETVRPGGYLWVDFVDYSITQELKTDHPLNWTLVAFWRGIPKGWSISDVRRVDDRHVGILLEKL